MLAPPDTQETREPDAHGEMSVVNEARTEGLCPRKTVATWNFCSSCQSFLQGAGATFGGPGSAKWR
jgi:hypothetical protein